MRRILDAKYEKVDLNKVVRSSDYPKWQTHRFLHPQINQNAKAIHGNRKVISEHSRNLKGILHNFIRLTIENIHGP